jgi:hypothetical protein
VTSALSPLSPQTAAEIGRQIKAMMEADPVVAGLAVAETAHTYRVENDEDEKVLTDGLKAVAGATRSLEGEQRRLVKLLVDPIEEFVRAPFREKLDLLKRAREIGEKLILSYRAKRRARLEAEATEQRRLAAEASKAEVEETGLSVPTATVAVERPSNVTRGGVGSSIGTTRLRVRLADVRIIAETRPYLLQLRGADGDGWVTGPNQPALLEVKHARIRDLKAQVPGLEWEEVEGLSIR